jgi:hypothetical protein
VSSTIEREILSCFVTLVWLWTLFWVSRYNMLQTFRWYYMESHALFMEVRKWVS